MIAPQIVMVDAPRVRRDDPETSHRAGDRSADSIPAVKAAVISLVAEHGALTGSEINTLYAENRVDHDWPVVHWDTPRKRAGELAEDRLLNILNADHPRGTESEYTLLGAIR